MYKAIHKPTLTLVAIKELPMASASKRATLKKELKVLYTQLQGLAGDKPNEEYVEMLENKAYRSNHVVSFFDAYSTEDGFANVVMEFMNGGSLQDLIDKGGSKNEAVIRNVALGMLRGLEELHKNKFLHRDMKPANVLLGTNGKVKVADFGVAKDLASSKDLAQTFIGTFLYMSPERINGDDYGSTADIWGLGMTLLATFLGKFPHNILDKHAAYWEMYDKFVAQDCHRMEDQVRAAGGSKELEEFVMACLCKDPAKRPSATQLLSYPFLTIVGSGTETEDGSEANEKEDEDMRLARNAEIMEVVTCCKEHGMKFHRKRTDFSVIASQIGVSEDYLREMFCSRKTKKKPSPQTKRISSSERLRSFGKTLGLYR